MERINLWESTSFKKAPFWGNATRKVLDDGVLTVTYKTGDSYSAVSFAGLKPKEKYVFLIDAEVPATQDHSVQVYTSAWSWLALINETNGGRGKCEFTAPDSGGIIIVLYPVNNDPSRSSTFKRPLLELKSTYDAGIAAGGPDFFTYNTMPISIN